MSVARAVTQLVKSHVKNCQKLKVLNEEKDVQIELVNAKYQEKEKTLIAEVTSTTTALAALCSQDEVNKLCDEYCRENNIDLAFNTTVEPS